MAFWHFCIAISLVGIATIRQVLDWKTMYTPGASIIVTHVRLFLSRSGQTTRLAYVVARTWTNVTSAIPLSVHCNIYLHRIYMSAKRIVVSWYIPPFSINLKNNFRVISMIVNSTQVFNSQNSRCEIPESNLRITMYLV